MKRATKTRKPAAKAKAKPAGRIAEAVGTSVRATTPNKSGRSLSQTMEAAMVEAINKAQTEGVTDPKEIRKRILAAREAVKSV